MKKDTLVIDGEGFNVHKAEICHIVTYDDPDVKVKHAVYQLFNFGLADRDGPGDDLCCIVTEDGKMCEYDHGHDGPCSFDE